MKYILRIAALGMFPELTIDENEFNLLRNAKEMLSDGLAIEEKYEILLENFLEMELEALSIAAQSMVRPDFSYESFYQVRVRLNRRIVNLLTAARLYIDSLPQHVENLRLQGAKERVGALLANEYDTFPDYRFMEALRNYAQHRGIPVHIFGVGAYRNENNLLAYTLNMASSKKLLLEDKQFKKSVVGEIPENVNLERAARIYVERISNVHSQVRILMGESLLKARRLIESALFRYSGVYPDKTIGLSAMCLAAEDQILEEIPLLLDWDDVRIILVKKNQHLKNLSSRYVSNRVPVK